MLEFNFPDEIPLCFTGICKILVWNSIRSYKGGKLHREDGPAHIHSFGKEYYQYGLLHRENGPACEFKNGENHYCIKGKLHREDGPAVEYFDGKKAWHYKNKCYGTDDSFTIETWIEKVKEFKYLESLEIFK